MGEGGIRGGVGRLAALVTVVAMTALPFVSCSAGPLQVEFDGHELLRNARPEVEEDVARSRDGERLFSGKDAWLHAVYVAAFAAAVLGIFVARRAAAATAVAGLAATIAFLIGFHALLDREMRSEASGRLGRDAPGLELEAGAYLALIGFAVSALDGARRRRG